MLHKSMQKNINFKTTAMLETSLNPLLFSRLLHVYNLSKTTAIQSEAATR